MALNAKLKITEQRTKDAKSANHLIVLHSTCFSQPWLSSLSTDAFLLPPQFLPLLGSELKNRIIPVPKNIQTDIIS
ncbi:hypothetical protein ACTXT7_004350 [Hymenolepis weldensis]